MLTLGVKNPLLGILYIGKNGNLHKRVLIRLSRSIFDLESDAGPASPPPVKGPNNCMQQVHSLKRGASCISVPDILTL